MQEYLIYLALATLFLATWFSRTPKFKGMIGEWSVRRSLKKHLDPQEYRILNDVTLPTPDGGTTQIDHVVLSRYGLFVIETKNMSGWIFGESSQPYWTQVIFRWRSKFRNPLRQNHKHVKTIQNLLTLKSSQIHNVVAFVGSAEPQTRMPENVVWGKSSLAGYIKFNRYVVLDEQHRDELVSKLLEFRLRPGFWTDRQHIRNVQRQLSGNPSESALCPRCGAAMTERVNGKTGDRFLGCTKYPRCRGTRQLD